MIKKCGLENFLLKKMRIKSSKNCDNIKNNILSNKKKTFLGKLKDRNLFHF